MTSPEEPSNVVHLFERGSDTPKPDTNHNVEQLTNVPDKVEELQESPFINKIGVFYVTDLVVNSPQMALILSVMQFVPYSVNFDYSRGLFKFVGYSPHFESKENLYGPNSCYRVNISGVPGESFKVTLAKEAGFAPD